MFPYLEKFWEELAAPCWQNPGHNMVATVDSDIGVTEARFVLFLPRPSCCSNGHIASGSFYLVSERAMSDIN